MPKQKSKIDPLVVEIFTKTTLQPRLIGLMRENIVLDILVTKRLKEREISRKFKYFLLIKQDPTIDTQIFFRKYNQTLGAGFPVAFLALKDSISDSTILRAEINNYNYMRLVTDFRFKAFELEPYLKKSKNSILKTFGYGKDLYTRFDDSIERYLNLYQFRF